MLGDFRKICYSFNFFLNVLPSLNFLIPLPTSFPYPYLIHSNPCSLPSKLISDFINCLQIHVYNKEIIYINIIIYIIYKLYYKYYYII